MTPTSLLYLEDLNRRLVDYRERANDEQDAGNHWGAARMRGRCDELVEVIADLTRLLPKIETEAFFATEAA